MKCLSIQQPWAWAILHAGKTIENRGWSTRHRGPLLIHAGVSRRALEGEDRTAWPQVYGVELPHEHDLVFGAIVGVVDVVDVLPLRGLPLIRSPWAEGPWLWLLENARPLPCPVPCRGMPGLFDVPESIALEYARCEG